MSTWTDITDSGHTWSRNQFYVSSAHDALPDEMLHAPYGYGASTFCLGQQTMDVSPEG